VPRKRGTPFCASVPGRSRQADRTNDRERALTTRSGICDNQLMRLCRHTLLLLFGSGLLALAGLCGGCQTSGKSLFIASGPGWHVQEGQALWRPGTGYPELAGDLVLATHADGRSLLQFSKTPLSLVTAQLTPTHWLIEFPPAGIGFSGMRQPPVGLGDTRLRAPKDAPSGDANKRPSTRFLWLYLSAALSGQPLPPQLRFERKPDGGWRLENARVHETLEGFLAP
jgi:hypothetical protein